ncbi:nucleotide pyrophosphohydrolase [Candidatus Woesearchaeota archaeon]|nr:nucleotide pyrophosphohydrolase [Candidatus Woesearchaeota archaeon]
MSLKESQDRVDEWVQQYKMGYWKPHEIFARLAEEVGEVGREINHQFGPKKKKAGEEEHNLGVEMADVIFTLCCLANSQGINLNESFDRVMEKCYGRDKDRFEKK